MEQTDMIEAIDASVAQDELAHLDMTAVQPMKITTAAIDAWFDD